MGKGAIEDLEVIDEASFEPERNRWSVRSNDGSVARDP
jgi:hypothetical protein